MNECSNWRVKYGVPIVSDSSMWNSSDWLTGATRKSRELPNIICSECDMIRQRVQFMYISQVWSKSTWTASNGQRSANPDLLHNKRGTGGLRFRLQTIWNATLHPAFCDSSSPFHPQRHSLICQYPFSWCATYSQTAPQLTIPIYCARYRCQQS